MSNRRAFTLVESLVVLAIIAVLAAILFPVFARVKAAAKGATCLSNLRQIGTATALYGADADDRLPFAASSDTKHYAPSIFAPRYGEPYDTLALIAPDIRVALSSYASGDRLWSCPLDQIDEILALEGGHASTWRAEVGSSYAYDEVHGLVGWPLSGYTAPAESIVFVDLGAVHPRLIGPSAGYQAVFADGHAKRITNVQRLKGFAPLSFLGDGL